jgi:hypothetical protein
LQRCPSRSDGLPARTDVRPRCSPSHTACSRPPSLGALEAFIQSQTALLDTTRTDIQRLRETKARAIADPAAFLDNLHAEVTLFSVVWPAAARSPLPSQARCPGFPPQHAPGLAAHPPERSRLGCFRGPWYDCSHSAVRWLTQRPDPAPLQKFTLDAQQALVARHQPHPTQKSPLSDLQKLVKNARRTIIDPVLAAFAQISDLDDDNSESEIDEAELQREREREKIRQLKRRKIRTCGLKLPGLRMEGSTAVFIRHDVEDESMDVEISLADDGQPLLKHRATREAAKGEALPPPRKKVRKKDSNKSPPPKLQADPQPPPGKPKPETYKQAWSISEQHLLEQLLEQIPEGEKYR